MVKPSPMKPSSAHGNFFGFDEDRPCASLPLSLVVLSFLSLSLFIRFLNVS